MVEVSEQAYMQNEQARLDDLAMLIRECGITVYELAKGTRVKYETILRALRRKSIRPENEARIRLYIKIKQDEEANNQSESC